ncbi:MAG: aminotransferase class IV [Proteobacteria bacterium]|nr:aminotransferase class IV [Pseudomonadota bacterium]
MSLLWLDGEVRYSHFAPFDLRDRGLALGDGLFETILVMNRKALWLSLHLDRMAWSAEALGIPFVRSRAELATADLLAKAETGPYVLRITLTRGIAARGLAGDGAAPSLFAALDPFDAALIGQPARLMTSGIRRSVAAPSASHKTLSYIDNIAAARAAKAEDCDDALMLNSEGQAACSTIANLFLLQGGKLVTPALDQGILPGVTRAVVLKLTGELGMATEERAVAPVELFAADAVFLTNSLRFIRPVLALDKRPLGEADVQPILDALLAAAKAQCGVALPVA